MFCIRYLKFAINIQSYKNILNIERLQAKASTAEKLIISLKAKIDELKNHHSQQASVSKTNELVLDNDRLRFEIDMYKNELISLETKRGIQQVPLECKLVKSVSSTIKNELPIESTATKADAGDSVVEKKEIKPKKVKIVDGGKKAIGTKPVDEPPIDVGRLDFRVGNIINIKKHPDADSLYVEEIDVGEGKNRTVISGLVKYISMEELKNKMVVVLCNLKPVKMRGITSEGMVMCASTPEKIEVLIPPSGSVPGDLVHVDGYPRVVDSILNPKKKIFETCAPDLKTNTQKQAVYKEALLQVPGKGPIIAPSLAQVQVK